MSQQRPNPIEMTVEKPSRLLARAMREDSKREIAWLWLADDVPTLEEREYCLRRVLHLNRNNIEARRALNIVCLERRRALRRGANDRCGLLSTVLGLFAR